jgi:pyrroloquinoline quinone (PQQ) biosynthesis protein C
VRSTLNNEHLPADRIVEKYERLEVSAHPLFVRLKSEPVDLRAIWFLVANLRAGISGYFVPWLATTIARIDDRRIASLIAKQLADELGNGEFTEIHSVLLDRFLAGLERWQPRNVSPEMLMPGRTMAERATTLFHASDPYEGVGALIVGEIFAKKMDRCLGDEIRRQDAIPSDALKWLILHETLEVDHAEDSGALAELIPKQGPSLAATWCGAIAEWEVLWNFLTDVHKLAMVK